MKIEIFGTGCAKCKRLEKHVQRVLSDLKMKAEIRKVDDLSEIMNRGVIMTPALAIDGKIVFAGRTSDLDEIREIIKRHRKLLLVAPIPLK